MAYTKKFWEERKYDDSCKRGEHKYFTEGRLNKIMDLPYSFVIIGINHKSNFTGRLRKNDENILKKKGSNQEANFYNTWDDETQMFVDSLSTAIKYSGLEEVEIESSSV